MLFRAIALSLALMLSMGTIITLTTNYSEAGARYHKKKRKKLKKYSKAWWKWYRAKKRRQRALAARKRALRLRQIRLARQKRLGIVPVAKSDSTKQPKNSPTRERVASDNSQAMLPTGEAAPSGWKRNQTPTGELQYNVDDESGKNIGSVSLADVGPANGAENEGRKTVGGVQTSALRRTVIDRMMRQQGWVVNDFQKEVGGKKVYVVVAQSQGANGRVQTHTFYFTESGGRIYSLAANSDNDSTERLAQESEKVINSLQRNRPTQQADLR